MTSRRRLLVFTRSALLWNFRGFGQAKGCCTESSSEAEEAETEAETRLKAEGKTEPEAQEKTEDEALSD